MSLHAADTASLLERVESLEAENRLLRRLLEQHQHAPADRERDQRRLEAAENLSRIGTWEWSADAREAQVSRGLRRLLGLADDAPTPTIRRLLTYLPPVDRQRAIILLRRLRAEGETFVEEFALADNPGMRLRAAGMAEFDERRRLTRLFIVVQDITAVWSEARARRHLELRWHYLINTCPDAVFIARLADGRIVDCNDAAARLTGHDTDALLGRSPVELGLWSDLDQQRAVWEMINQPRESACVTMKHRDGSVCQVLLHLQVATLEGESWVVSYARPLESR